MPCRTKTTKRNPNMPVKILQTNLLRGGYYSHNEFIRPLDPPTFHSGVVCGDGKNCGHMLCFLVHEGIEKMEVKKERPPSPSYTPHPHYEFSDQELMPPFWEVQLPPPMPVIPTTLELYPLKKTIRINNIVKFRKDTDGLWHIVEYEGEMIENPDFKEQCDFSGEVEELTYTTEVDMCMFPDGSFRINGGRTETYNTDLPIEPILLSALPRPAIMRLAPWVVLHLLEQGVKV